MDCGFSIGTQISYNTQEMSEISVSSKIDQTALTDSLLIATAEEIVLNFSLVLLVDPF